MSLDHIQSQVDELRSKAEGVQDSWNRTIKDVNADETLSATGKRDKLDSEYTQLKGHLDALRAKEVDLIAAKQQSLEKSLFGLPAATIADPNRTIAYRDAQERAARLQDHNDARELYDFAMLSEDKILAGAIIAKALANGWPSIVNDYTSRHPAAREDLADLNEIQRYDRMQATMSYMILSPSMVSGV